MALHEDTEQHESVSSCSVKRLIYLTYTLDKLIEWDCVLGNKRGLAPKVINPSKYKPMLF